MNRNDTKTKEGPVDESSEKEKLLAIKVGDKLYQMVDSHITAIKRLTETKCTRNDWLKRALKEKLDREKQLTADSIPLEKRISVFLDKHLQHELEERVAALVRVMKGYSKKRFMIEAILEKIEMEKETVLAELLAQQQKGK